MPRSQPRTQSLQRGQEAWRNRREAWRNRRKHGAIARRNRQEAWRNRQEWLPQSATEWGATDSRSGDEVIYDSMPTMGDFLGE